MFDDPQVLIGAVIGLLVVAVGTTVATLEHLRKRREEDAEEGADPRP